MQDRLPQSRSDAVLQARTGHITVLRELLPYIWPANRPDLRWRVVFALGALVVAKAITLAVPIAYKQIIDLLTGQASSGTPAGGVSMLGLAMLPAMLIVAYGVGRILMVVFAQFRDIWFTVVAQHAVRELANRTFRHLHELSLRFHLERRTGGLSRVIERGVNGVDTIVRMAVLNSIPTAVELLMISGLVAWYFGWIYVGGRAGHRWTLCLVHVLGERTAHLHSPRHERVRHRGALEGRGQSAQLRDGQIFQQ